MEEIKNTKPKKRYKVDFEKVTSLEDIKLILESVKFSFGEDFIKKEGIKDLLIEE